MNSRVPQIGDIYIHHSGAFQITDFQDENYYLLRWNINLGCFYEKYYISLTSIQITSSWYFVTPEEFEVELVHMA